VCLVPAVLFLPLLVCTRTIAALKAAQAVRSSSVKLKGRDVVSTWKIMVSMAACPTLYLVYTALAFSLAREYLPPPWSLEAGLLFFFLFPFVSYGAIKGGENVVRVSRSLVPLFMAVLRPGYVHTLVEQRAALRERMLGLVDEQGWVTRAETPPQGPEEVAREVSALRLSASSPEHRMLEKMHGEAEEAAKNPLQRIFPRIPSAQEVLRRAQETLERTSPKASFTTSTHAVMLAEGAPAPA